MKKVFLSVAFLLLSYPVALSTWAQNVSAMQLLKSDPRRAYGTDYPYLLEMPKLTPAPDGYHPFYISHYGRHGSRYYWNSTLYKELDTLLTVADKKHLLTPVGEAFMKKFMLVKDELQTGVSELTDLGWQQHQGIARIMYNNFPEVFEKGGNVLAISSLVGRCVLSMSAFCQELVQCNPKLEIREQSSRFTLDGVVPTDDQNPVKHKYPKNLKPRFEKNRDKFKEVRRLRDRLVDRMFVSTEGLPGRMHHITSNLLHLYTSLPSIGQEGMMEGLVSDAEIAAEWEADNLGSYSWVFGPQYQMIPILQDVLKKASAVIDGRSDRVADLRFGHDTCIGPLTVLMGINGADLDPEDPNEVKNCYQNWETCKASNIQLIFYRGHNATDDILVKCLMNGREATLPVPTNNYPYYKWSDFNQFYTERCAKQK
ncbi:MAG: hypothetical protein J6P41_05540 [Prevotella sp.]|nr:hypothetical protein [Prevotella sp.]